MTRFESVLEQALALDESEREMLVFKLGETLTDQPEPGYHEAWDAEIKARLEELDRGEIELVDWEEAEKLIFDD